MRFRFVLVAAAVLAAALNASAQCARQWVASPNGVTVQGRPGAVYAMTTWDPDGVGPQQPVLVVAGYMDRAGDVPVNNIVMWDGSVWRTIGTGLDGYVYALAVFNGQLYAGGAFTTAGGVTARHFAVWTGSAWQEAGGGTSGNIQCLTPFGNELLVGGSFSSENNGVFPYARGARFTAGGGWVGFGATPIQSSVISIGTYGSHALLLGNPPLSGNYTNLYSWDGSTLTATGRAEGVLGSGPSGVFFTTTVDSGSLGTGCPIVQEYVIRMTTGQSSSPSLNFHKPAGYFNLGGQLHAVGRSIRLCDQTCCARNDPWHGVFNDSGWDDSTILPPGSVCCEYNGALYSAGVFSTPGNSIAVLNGAAWLPVGPNLDALPRAAVGVGPSFYTTGDFNTFGATALGHAAVFNGSSWASIGTLNGPGSAIAYYAPNPSSFVGSGVIVSGSFSTINGAAFSRIARRDSTSGNWIALGTGLNAPANAFLSYVTSVSHADLIVGGQFTNAGGSSTNYVARWTGAAWQAMSTGMNGEVKALANLGGTIYAAGLFTAASGVTSNSIASWNGSSWAPLSAGGMNGPVRALVVYSGQLYAAGDFTTAGGVPALHIAAYNGTSWSAVGSGLDDSVTSLVVSGTDLIAGGNFTHAGSSPVSHIAAWNGSSWLKVGADYAYLNDGVDGLVTALAANSSGDLFATGQFTHAGLELSPFAARALVPGVVGIRTQPTSASVCPGDGPSFTCESYDTEDSIQWYLNGAALVDGPLAHGTYVTGSTQSTVTFVNAQPGDAGDLWCTASNACGSHATSNTVQFGVGGPSCPATCGSADFNCDGDTGTDLDIEAFFRCLAGTCPGSPCLSSADFNADGDTGTDLDIEAFFRVLAGGTC